MSARVLIVGGGISGLATAYYLGKSGIDSVLVEKSKQLGGLIRTDLVDGCRLEAGPDSYIATKTAVTEIAAELGHLGQQIIGSNDAARRIYLVRAGRLIAFPAGMSMMVPGRWMPALRSSLFSARTKMLFLRETMQSPRQRAGDISVGELVTDHFGKQVLEAVTEPLLSGVYGGNAAELSAASVLPKFVAYERRYGSLIKGVRREKSTGPKGSLFLSFRDGMQSLTDALTTAISPHTKVATDKVVALNHSKGEWDVQLAGGKLTAEQVVMACPAYVSGSLLENVAPELAAELLAIPYSSAILASFLYSASSIRRPLNGFGFLVPQGERQTIAAATWINTKFPSRVAPGLIAIRAFIVANEAKTLLGSTDTELLKLVKADLLRLLKIDAKPQHAAIQRWPASMPQYVVGHTARQQKISALASSIPTLHLTGNAYDGVGIPDCIRLAKQVALRVNQIKSW